MKTTASALAAGLLVLGLAACSGDRDEPTPRASATATATTGTTPAASASPTARPTADEGVVVDVTIADGTVTPQGDRVEVGVGEPVTLRVQSDEADEIHVHSDLEHSLEVEPGQEGVLTFSVERPGQVAVESHHLDATIVQLVVR